MLPKTFPLFWFIKFKKNNYKQKNTYEELEST